MLFLVLNSIPFLKNNFFFNFFYFVLNMTEQRNKTCKKKATDNGCMKYLLSVFV